MMLAHYGSETGVNMARKHLGWYTKGLPGSAEFRNVVNQVPDADRVLSHARRLLCAMALPGSRLIRFSRRGAGDAEAPAPAELIAALLTAVLVDRR